METSKRCVGAKCHSNPLTTNLCQSNIVIDATGRACIAGLDLITATSDSESTTYFLEVSAARLAAPEVLSGETTITKAADIFSFAMLMVEVWAHDVLAIGRVIDD